MKAFWKRHSWFAPLTTPSEPDVANETWRQKQMLASPSRYYGDGGTIHGSTDLDVEVRDGKVVAVWFRCQMLPFRQCDVSATRAESMVRSYEYPKVSLTGVEVRD